MTSCRDQFPTPYAQIPTPKTSCSYYLGESRCEEECRDKYDPVPANRSPWDLAVGRFGGEGVASLVYERTLEPLSRPACLLQHGGWGTGVGELHQVGAVIS